MNPCAKTGLIFCIEGEPDALFNGDLFFDGQSFSLRGVNPNKMALHKDNRKLIMAHLSRETVLVKRGPQDYWFDSSGAVEIVSISKSFKAHLINYAPEAHEALEFVPAL